MKKETSYVTIAQYSEISPEWRQFVPRINVHFIEGSYKYKTKNKVNPVIITLSCLNVPTSKKIYEVPSDFDHIILHSLFWIALFLLSSIFHLLTRVKKIYLFIFNNRNTRAMSEIVSKLKAKTLEQRWPPCPGV